jgi:hypothetical protein
MPEITLRNRIIFHVKQRKLRKHGRSMGLSYRPNSSCSGFLTAVSSATSSCASEDSTWESTLPIYIGNKYQNLSAMIEPEDNTAVLVTHRRPDMTQGHAWGYFVDVIDGC